MLFRVHIHFSCVLIGLLALIDVCADIKSVHDDIQEISFSSNDQVDYNFTVLTPDYNHDDICVYRFLDQQKNSYIVFIKDAQGYHYVVKQEKNRSLKNQFMALCEVLGAYMASEMSIHSHHVRLLPVEMNFPGKFITKRVATLHTVVPGKTIRSLSYGEYAKLDIKQTTDKEIPFEKQGFNERTIFFMSLHPQLPYIVALDTFTGNKDRNKANILYDEETDSFYVIDMSLMHNDVINGQPSVSQVACKQVSSMIEQHKKFTNKEQQALFLYRITLQELVRKFPPKRVYDLLDDLVLKSGLLSERSDYDEKEVNALLSLYKRGIKQSYVEVKKLIYLLYILINK